MEKRVSQFRNDGKLCKAKEHYEKSWLLKRYTVYTYIMDMMNLGPLSVRSALINWINTEVQTTIILAIKCFSYSFMALLITMWVLCKTFENKMIFIICCSALGIGALNIQKNNRFLFNNVVETINEIVIKNDNQSEWLCASFFILLFSLQLFASPLSNAAHFFFCWNWWEWDSCVSRLSTIQNQMLLRVSCKIHIFYL